MVPIVIVDGDARKLEQIRELLPDLTFTTWGAIQRALKRAIAHPPEHPTVPTSDLAGYADAPLVKKLGVKPDFTVTMIGAPARFEQTLGVLPDGVRLRRRARGTTDLVLWFVQTQADVTRRIAQISTLAGSGGLWIVWPKQTSGVRTDLTQTVVRKLGLASGLVDYKVCSVDRTWSGLRFARREGS
jgi:hypothetical protein